MYIFNIHNIIIYIYTYIYNICMYICLHKSQTGGRSVEGMEFPVVLNKYHVEILGVN